MWTEESAHIQVRLRAHIKEEDQETPHSQAAKHLKQPKEGGAAWSAILTRLPVGQRNAASLRTKIIPSWVGW